MSLVGLLALRALPDRAKVRADDVDPPDVLLLAGSGNIPLREDVRLRGADGGSAELGGGRLRDDDGASFARDDLSRADEEAMLLLPELTDPMRLPELGVRGTA